MGAVEDTMPLFGDMEFGDCAESPNGLHKWRLIEVDQSCCLHCGEVAQTSNPLLPPDRYRQPRTGGARLRLTILLPWDRYRRLRTRAAFPLNESTETFSVGEDVYEWDKDKRDEALKKHGVDFKDAWKVVWDPEQTTAERYPLMDENGAYTGYEGRTRAFGRIDGKLHLVVYTMRGDNFRIISMRRVGEEELLPHKICQNCRWQEYGPDTMIALGNPLDSVMNCGFPGSQKGRKIRMTDTCDNFEDFNGWWHRERDRRPPSGGGSYDEARIKAYYGEYE